MILAPTGLAVHQVQAGQSAQRHIVATQDSRTAHVTTGEGFTDFQRARLNQFEGDFEAQRAAYQRAIERSNPASRPYIWLELASQAAIQGQKREARYGFEKAIQSSRYDSKVVPLAERGQLEWVRRAGSRKNTEPAPSTLVELFDQVNTQYELSTGSDDARLTDTSLTSPERPTREQRMLNSFLNRVTPIDPSGQEH
jgi:tetratricopeptide (TPR) repeat protein